MDDYDYDLNGLPFSATCIWLCLEEQGETTASGAANKYILNCAQPVLFLVFCAMLGLLLPF